MKILMVLENEFPPDTRVENEIQTLSNAGHEIHLACLTFQNKKEFEQKENYLIHRKKISDFTFKTSVGCLKFPFYFNFWRKYLIELFRKYSFEAIHIHDLQLGFVGLEIKKKFNIPLTMDLHENFPALLEKAVHTNTFLGKILFSSRQWRKYEKDVLQKTDKIITVVEEMKERLVSIGIDKNKIFIVSNTLKISSFPLPDKKPDSEFFTLFYAGGLNYHRGLQVVIKALKTITSQIPEARLWIVGKGSFLKELERLVTDLDLSYYTKFWGWKNLNEIADLLMQSDIALIPHLKYEHTDSTIPHKLFQYMFAEKPIVASNCKPLQRILEETGTGLVYENIDQLINIISKLFFDKEAYKSFALNGKMSILEKYNWQKSGKILIDLYQSSQK